jgi:hypothetical protein
MEEVVAAVVLPITLIWIARKLIKDDRDAISDSRGAYLRDLNERMLDCPPATLRGDDVGNGGSEIAPDRTHGRGADQGELPLNAR